MLIGFLFQFLVLKFPTMKKLLYSPLKGFLSQSSLKSFLWYFPEWSPMATMKWLLSPSLQFSADLGLDECLL